MGASVGGGTVNAALGALSLRCPAWSWTSAISDRHQNDTVGLRFGLQIWTLTWSQMTMFYHKSHFVRSGVPKKTVCKSFNCVSLCLVLSILVLRNSCFLRETMQGARRQRLRDMQGHQCCRASTVQIEKKVKRPVTQLRTSGRAPS